MREERKVLFDFFDPSALLEFASRASINVSKEESQDSPSYVLIRNYQGKWLREGSYYHLIPGSLDKMNIRSNLDSSILGYETEILKDAPEIFGKTFRPNDFVFTEFPVFRPALPVLSDANTIEVVVHDVGQGNWNEIVMDGRAAVVYDLGCSYTARPSKMSRLLQSAVQRYQQDRPVLVISHWDLDHYALLQEINAPERLFGFVLVRTPPPTLTARKVYSRLQQQMGGGFSSVDGAQLPRQSPNPLELYANLNQQLCLYRARQNSSRNMSGFVCVVRTEESIAILPADHHYSQLQQYVCGRDPKKNEFLVVPHHGGYAGKMTLPQVGTSKRKAIVSVGKNGYDHPKPSLLAGLKKANYDDFITRNRGKGFRGVL